MTMEVIGAKKVVLEVGMHRSGTSTLAGSLHFCNIYLGDNLMSAHKSNPKGFFEDKGIFDRNKRILATLNSSYRDLYFLPSNWQELD